MFQPIRNWKTSFSAKAWPITHAFWCTITGLQEYEFNWIFFPVIYSALIMWFKTLNEHLFNYSGVWSEKIKTV